MKVREISRGAHHFTFQNVGSGWTQKALFISDVHWDSKKCDRKLLKKHFEQAKKDNALIFIFGDWFDVMGCKNDPRSKPKDIRPEYLIEGSYLDLVVEDAVNFLKNYLENIAFISPGNHETAIDKHRDTDPLKNMIRELNHMRKTPIMYGKYEGWIKFQIERSGIPNKSKLLHYHHGYGGNAKRSKSILNADIDMKENPDADILVSGHTHTKWHLPAVVRRLTNQMRVIKKKVHVLKTGSYKMKGSGWETEKGFGEPTLGGWWCELAYFKDEIEIRIAEAS